MFLYVGVKIVALSLTRLRSPFSGKLPHCRGGVIFFAANPPIEYFNWYLPETCVDIRQQGSGVPCRGSA